MYIKCTDDSIKAINITNRLCFEYERNMDCKNLHIFHITLSERLKLFCLHGNQLATYFFQLWGSLRMFVLSSSWGLVYKYDVMESQIHMLRTFIQNSSFVGAITQV